MTLHTDGSGPTPLPLHEENPAQSPEAQQALEPQSLSGAEQYLANVGEVLAPLPGQVQPAPPAAAQPSSSPRAGQPGQAQEYSLDPSDLHRELLARDTALSTARESLRDIGRYMDSLMGIIQSAVFIVTPEGTIKSVNESMAGLLDVKMEEIEGRGWSDLIRIPSDNPPAANRQNDARHLLVEAHEAYIKKNDLEEIPIVLTGRALYDSNRNLDAVLCSATDLSDRRHLEGELRHAQKLESVGQLAAGVAHEINTPIQFIGDSVFFLQDAFKDLRLVVDHYRGFKNRLASSGKAPKVVEDFNRIESEADLNFLEHEIPDALERAIEGINRVASIVGAMKKFAHPGGEDRSPQDLNEAIETTLVVSRNEYKYVADVEKDLGQIPPVMCNLGDINQVLLNLIVNAAHAIESKHRGAPARGTIKIVTRLAGENVEILLSDTGSGIPSQIRSKIFAPFFTTKPVGKGTGQGLSIARNLIVDKHQGDLKFTTTEGVGTTFIITLPIQGEA